MCASLETLVIAAYVFADSLAIPRPGPAGKVTDAELIALAVAQAITGCARIASSWARSGGFCPAISPTCPTNRNTTAGCAG